MRICICVVRKYITLPSFCCANVTSAKQIVMNTREFFFIKFYLPVCIYLFSTKTNTSCKVYGLTHLALRLIKVKSPVNRTMNKLFLLLQNYETIKMAYGFNGHYSHYNYWFPGILVKR